MSASESFAHANELFVEEAFGEAVSYYDIALALATSTNTRPTTLATYYLHRAHCHMKLKNFRAALNDTDQSLHHVPDNGATLFRKGTAQFALDQFSDALTSFLRAEQMGYKPSECKLWVRKTNAELKRTGGTTSTTSTATPTSAAATSTPASASAPTSASTSASAPASTTTPSTGTLADKVNTGFFQTSKDVTITIFAKGTKRDAVELKVSDRTIDITLVMPDGSKFNKTWNLFAAIDTNYHMDHTPYKIELVLKKIIAEHWDALESVPIPVPVQKRENTYEGKLESYPTSRPIKTNWTEVEKAAVKQEEEEKPEGEAALNKLFQSIYGNADEDTRRAMIKSYQTSGGTVLSTNWKEVADKDYTKERTPPKGQEFRDWNK